MSILKNMFFYGEWGILIFGKIQLFYVLFLKILQKDGLVLLQNLFCGIWWHKKKEFFTER